MIENNSGINKLRKCKRKLEQLNKIIMKYVDLESEKIIDPETIKELLLISEIDALITDVIYYIIDNQNCEKE